MGNFVAFLIFSALHIPAIIAVKNAENLDPPKLQILGGTDIEHPILRIYSKEPSVIHEIQYLLPKGDAVFWTRMTQTDLEVVPGVAPCRVRVRARVGQIVSKWSKTVDIKLVEIDPIYGLRAKDGY